MQSYNNTEISPTIAIVAGEISGDILGSGLIRELKNIYPQAKFVGIGGELMQQQGFTSWFNMEDLAVMGLTEVIKHLPKIIKIRKLLIKKILQLKPDIYVGIDAPDFNLGVELAVKNQGIKTIHYVSPSVWAWRQKRIYKIAKATNLVLSFLPFEKSFYDKYNVPCKFIGHKMADDIPLSLDKNESFKKLDLEQNKKYLAIMPGSRNSEIEMLTKIFLQTAVILKKEYPDLEFILPLANQKYITKIQQIQQEVASDLTIHFVEHGLIRESLNISEVALVASGTATLEVMLCKTPMVVAYKVKPITYKLANRLIKVKYFSLPNLLSDYELVPELIQDDCKIDLLVKHLKVFLSKKEEDLQNKKQLIAKFQQLHLSIKKNADRQAALAVQEVIQNV